jgi:hypothetical protein
MAKTRLGPLAPISNSANSIVAGLMYGRPPPRRLPEALREPNPQTWGDDPCRAQARIIDHLERA